MFVVFVCLFVVFVCLFCCSCRFLFFFFSFSTAVGSLTCIDWCQAKNFLSHAFRQTYRQTQSNRHTNQQEMTDSQSDRLTNRDIQADGSTDTDMQSDRQRAKYADTRAERVRHCNYGQSVSEELHYVIRRKSHGKSINRQKVNLT